VDAAGSLTDATIIVADALHHILSVTRDLQSVYQDDIQWDALVRDGFVPPVLKVFDVDPNIPTALSSMIPPELLCQESMAADPSTAALHTDTIDQNLVLHSGLITATGRYCTMSDLMDSSGHALKISISSSSPLTEEQDRLFLTFLQVIQISYQRFRSTTASDRYGYLLRQLIHGETIRPIVTGNSTSFFDVNGSFALVAFSTEHLDALDISFQTGLMQATEQSQFLSATLGNQYIILLNTNYEYQRLFHFLDSYAHEQRFPILYSSSFADLSQVRDHFLIISDSVSVASRFEGCIGLQNESAFSLFRMFLKLAETANASFFQHPDAEVLISHDKNHNSQYAQTVFRYLLQDCEATSAADALFIHRNTLDNRLRKINELINPDWRDFNYQVRMLYSLFLYLDHHRLLTWYSSGK
jgi:hypothetical protein